MWVIKKFKTKQSFDKWVKNNKDKCTFVEVFINNAYGVEYKRNRVINIE